MRQTTALLAAFSMSMALGAPATNLLAQTKGSPAIVDKSWPEKDPLGNPTGNIVDRHEESNSTSDEEYDDWTETTYTNDVPRKIVKVVRHRHHIYYAPASTPPTSGSLNQIHEEKDDSTEVFQGTVSVVDGTSYESDDGSGTWDAAHDPGGDHSPAQETSTYHLVYGPNPKYTSEIELYSGKETTNTRQKQDDPESTNTYQYDYDGDSWYSDKTLRSRVPYKELAPMMPAPQPRPQPLPTPGLDRLNNADSTTIAITNQPASATPASHATHFWTFGLPVLGLAAVIVPLEVAVPGHPAATRDTTKPVTTPPCSDPPCSATGSAHRRPAFAIQFRL